MADICERQRDDHRERVVSELERCRPWITAALEHSGGTHAWDDVVQGVLSGHMQLWPGEDFAFVTEITRYPRTKVCNMFLGGGNLDSILAMHEPVESWARAQGCAHLTISGRLGWKRSLQQHGWQPLHLVMAKEI